MIDQKLYDECLKLVKAISLKVLTTGSLLQITAGRMRFFS